MKKRNLVIFLAITSVLVGGTIMSIQKQNIFSNDTHPSKQLSAREKQLAYLKDHEKDMADFVKSLSPKVDSVQFNWDSMEVGEIGNGTPQGGGYMLTLDGRINNNKDTKFTLGIPLKRDSNEVPEELVIYEMQPIRILRDGGWFLYD